MTIQSIIWAQISKRKIVNLEILFFFFFNHSNNRFEFFFLKCSSVFPHLPKLETLSVSYMPDLKIIGNGTFSNLPALLHISCQNNVYLSEIHAHAFAKPGAESAIREEWPPIRSVI